MAAIIAAITSATVKTKSMRFTISFTSFLLFSLSQNKTGYHPRSQLT